MAPRWGKIGVIAGAGVLPVRVAEACARRGDPVFVVPLAGIADHDFSAFEHAPCAIGEGGKMLRSLRDAGCDAVTLAGVVKRPDFSSLKVDWRGAAVVSRLIVAGRKGDGGLLEVLVETFGAEGFAVVGADEVTGDLTAPAGALGAVAPSLEDMADVRKADAVVSALVPFDVGQAAVVADGFVLAIEAAEGTDAMLARCASLDFGGGRRGVLVKRPKPGQELRVDLPTIGAETVRRVHAAGLSGVAVVAGKALVIDADETRAEADRLGVFVYGYDASEVRPSPATT